MRASDAVKNCNPIDDIIALLYPEYWFRKGAAFMISVWEKKAFESKDLNRNIQTIKAYMHLHSLLKSSQKENTASADYSRIRPHVVSCCEIYPEVLFCAGNVLMQ